MAEEMQIDMKFISFIEKLQTTILKILKYHNQISKPKESRKNCFKKPNVNKTFARLLNFFHTSGSGSLENSGIKKTHSFNDFSLS